MIYLIENSKNFHKSDSDSENYNMAYYCPHCGADLMSVFKYMKRTYHDINELNFRLTDIRDPKQAEKFKKTIKELSAENNETAVSGRRAEDAYKDAESAVSICPVCEGELYKKVGYFMPYYFHFSGIKYESYFSLNGEKEVTWLNYPKSAEEKLEHMKILRAEIETIEAQKRAENFLSNNDLPVTTKSDSAKQVQDSAENLKEYILTLLRLENNIYSLCRLLSELYYLELNCKRSIVLETNEPVYFLKEKNNKLKETCAELKEAYATVLAEVEKADSYKPKVSVKYPVKPTAPVLAKPGLFNKKKVLAENERLTQKYQAEMEAYHQEVKLCDEKKADMIEKKRADFIKKAKEKAELQKSKMDKAVSRLDKAASCLESAKKDMKDKIVPSQAANELLKKDIEETEALLKKTLKTRNELYGYNIVFEKYRNSVALSSFYEYLMSGRCSSLTGTDGAYNIYENEIRLNQVVSQLDVVISSLEEIKQTQYMIYSELQSINSSLDSLNSTMCKALVSVQNIEATTTKLSEHMEHIARNTDVIAHNTAVTAYYSKVNADLTNALGYMVALG